MEAGGIPGGPKAQVGLGVLLEGFFMFFSLFFWLVKVFSMTFFLFSERKERLESVLKGPEEPFE